MRTINSAGIVAYLLVVLLCAVFCPCTSAAMDGLAENASFDDPPAISNSTRAQEAEGSNLSTDALEAKLTTKADAPSEGKKKTDMKANVKVTIQIQNLDDDPLDWIYLDIDSLPRWMYSSTNSKGQVTANPYLSQEKHWFNITWKDPDPNKEYHLNYTKNITYNPSSPSFRQRKWENEADDIVFPWQSMMPITHRESLFNDIICLNSGELKL